MDLFEYSALQTHPEEEGEEDDNDRSKLDAAIRTVSEVTAEVKGLIVSHFGRDSGRPKVPLEISRLIRDMSLANPPWGAPRAATGETFEGRG